MKLKELASVMYSTRDKIQMAIVYDQTKNEDVELNCSIDYAIETYGEHEVKRIQAYGNYLIITI